MENLNINMTNVKKVNKSDIKTSKIDIEEIDTSSISIADKIQETNKPNNSTADIIEKVDKSSIGIGKIDIERADKQDPNTIGANVKEVIKFDISISKANAKK